MSRRFEPEVALTGRPGANFNLATGNLELTWYDHDHMEVAARAVLTPAEVAAFLPRVVSQGMTTLSHASEETLRGECGRCNNIRMVEVERSGGRKERVHCPDCIDRARPAFTDVPVPRFGNKGS